MGLDNPLHIAILVVILLLVFGAKRLPEMGRSIGAGMREFKDSISGDSAPTLPQTTTQTPGQSAAPAPATAPEAAVQPAAAPAEPTNQG